MTKYSLQICRSFLNFFMPLDAQELFSSILMQSNCQSSFTTGTFSKQSLSHHHKDIHISSKNCDILCFKFSSFTCNSYIIPGGINQFFLI